jgi:hypothetical protein
VSAVILAERASGRTITAAVVVGAVLVAPSPDPLGAELRPCDEGRAVATIAPALAASAEVLVRLPAEALLGWASPVEDGDPHQPGYVRRDVAVARRHLRRILEVLAPPPDSEVTLSLAVAAQVLVLGVQASTGSAALAALRGTVGVADAGPWVQR